MSMKPLRVVRMIVAFALWGRHKLLRFVALEMARREEMVRALSHPLIGEAGRSP